MRVGWSVFKHFRWLGGLPDATLGYIYICMYVCMYVCIHTYVHTYIQTYIHTYIHTYINLIRGAGGKAGYTTLGDFVIKNIDFIDFL